MLNIILLAQAAHDIAALPSAALALKALKADACWLIYSPAVLANAETMNAEFDRQIAALNEAIKQASAREDFDGAKGYKEQRDTVVMNKTASAKEAYKALTTDQQKEAAEKIFRPFYDSKPAPSLKISRHGDHYETANWIEMVNSLKGAWPVGLNAGDYVVTWPGQLAQMAGIAAVTIMKGVAVSSPVEVKDVPVTSPVVSAPVVKKERPKTFMQTKRFALLMAMGIEALGQEAIAAGIAQPSGTKRQIVYDTIRAEIAKAGGKLPE